MPYFKNGYLFFSYLAFEHTLEKKPQQNLTVSKNNTVLPYPRIQKRVTLI